MSWLADNWAGALVGAVFVGLAFWGAMSDDDHDDYMPEPGCGS